MYKYIAKYYFSNDFSVNRIIESENKEDALVTASGSEVINFEDSHGILHHFQLKDVKLITISAIVTPTQSNYPKPRTVSRGR